MQENVIMKYVVKIRHTASYGVSEKMIRCTFFQKVKTSAEIGRFRLKIGNNMAPPKL